MWTIFRGRIGRPCSQNLCDFEGSMRLYNVMNFATPRTYWTLLSWYPRNLSSVRGIHYFHECTCTARHWCMLCFTPSMLVYHIYQFTTAIGGCTGQKHSWRTWCCVNMSHDWNKVYRYSVSKFARLAIVRIRLVVNGCTAGRATTPMLPLQSLSSRFRRHRCVAAVVFAMVSYRVVLVVAVVAAAVVLTSSDRRRCRRLTVIACLSLLPVM